MADAQLSAVNGSDSGRSPEGTRIAPRERELLRRYHAAFRDPIWCHGDFSPWNLVWRSGRPVAVIDFDQVHVGDPRSDVGYALRMFVSYGLVDVPPAELVRRTRLALAAYGGSFDAASLLAAEYGAAEERCLRNGWHRQLDRLPLERAWLAEHRRLLGG